MGDQSPRASSSSSITAAQRLELAFQAGDHLCFRRIGLLARVEVCDHHLEPLEARAHLSDQIAARIKHPIDRRLGLDRVAPARAYSCPVSEAPPTDASQRSWIWLGAGILLVLVVLVVIVEKVGSGDSGSSQAAYTGRVAGNMSHDSIGVHVNGDNDAFEALTTSDVWCGWKDGHVFVHARFTNGWGADVVIDVSPAYVLENAGTHGDSSDIQAHVGAGRTVSWIGDAGQPEGVASPVRISSCAPVIEYVKAG
jgi:hypothetical protein